MLLLMGGLNFKVVTLTSLNIPNFTPICKTLAAIPVEYYLAGVVTTLVNMVIT